MATESVDISNDFEMVKEEKVVSKFTNNQNNVALDLNNLAAGTYHVQISGSEVYTVKKLVISK